MAIKNLFRPNALSSRLSATAVLIGFFIAVAIYPRALFAFPDQKSLSPDGNFADCLKLAKQERTSGHFQASVRLFKNCLALIRRNDDRSAMDCIYNMAVLYWNIGELAESKKCFIELAGLARKLGSEEIEATARTAIRIHDLYQAGKSFASSESYEQSIESFNLAIRLAKEVKIPEFETKCLRLLSLTYWQLNDFDNFFQLNLAALKLAELLNHNRERSKCLNNIGAYYSKYDNYGPALSSYEKALGIAIEESQVQDIAASLLNLGGTWSDLGDYDKSLGYLKRALNLDEALGDKSNIAKDLNNIGIAIRLRGLTKENNEDLAEAKKTFDDSLRIAKMVGDRGLEIQALNNVGSILADLKQFNNALEYFKRAALVAEQTNDSSYLGMVYNNIGIMYSNLGDYEQSTTYYDLALELSSAYKDGTFVWETYLELANMQLKQTHLDEAKKNYKNSIASIEDIRSRIKTEDLKASYLGTDKRLEPYQKLVDLLITLHRATPDRGYDKEAFNYLERAKARAFLDSLEVAQVDVSEGINPVLANRERELRRDIAKSYNRLLAPGFSREERGKVSDQIKASEDQLESLKREIRKSSPAYADLKYPEVITYDEAYDTFSAPGVAYFAYLVGNEASHAFVMTSRGLKIFDLPGRAVLQRQVSGYRKAVSDYRNRDFSIGRELFQELISTGLEPGIKKLVIVPDDILNLLPFETLLSSQESDSWLVRKYAVGYVPSLSSLRVLLQRRHNGSRPRKDILAIGNPIYGSGNAERAASSAPAISYDLSSSSEVSLPPLKYSALEIENVCHVFRQSKVTKLEREKATERWLKSSPLADYKIIHFAAHSIIDDKKPARSAIVLSYTADQAGGGLLQARDIYNLKLNADLVTLSSCQTGLGQFIRGEGIEGLSRAFFYAGSSSVLMSLWAVNDQATYLLMERFYRHLKSGESLIESLRDAKLEMIASGALSHPYYWAGFIINGRTDARVFPGSGNLATMLVSVLGVGLVLILMAALRKHKIA